MMKLRINPVVADDLKTIKNFIAEDNAEKALETAQEIYRVLNRYQDITRIFNDRNFSTEHEY